MRFAPLVAIVALGCSAPRTGSAPSALYHGGEAPLSRAADRVMREIPAGAYLSGSTPEERERAYQDYRATAGHDAARRGNWFEREAPHQRRELGRFRIDLAPVTNAAYAEFVADTGRRPPSIDEASWRKQRFSQDWATEVARFNWRDSQPPSGREEHPVVLVTWADAAAYCAWRGALVGASRRLPTEAEMERAARGTTGYTYPWGSEFDPSKLNSQVGGPRDTVPVGSYPSGASPDGVLDVAGNVFQWTSTPWAYGAGRRTVKGSAWDDFAGVGRGASRHGRREWIRHAIVGFRCAGD